MEVLETIRIDAIATGGDGVARLESGCVIFVPYSAPGDVAQVRIVEQSRRLARGEIVELIEAGPERAEARCPVFGSCGGCAFQHLDAVAQLDAKRRIVEDHLVRPGWVGDDRLGEVRSSPELWDYRVRMRFHVGDGVIGLYRRGSRNLVEASSCAIAAPAVRGAMAVLAPHARACGVRWFDVEAVAVDERARLLLVGEPADMPALRGLAERCLESELIFEVSVQCGRRHWTSAAHGAAAADADAPVGSFRQANPGANRLLHELVEAALPPGPEPILELFAGSGNFGLVLAEQGHPVTAVENDVHAVRAGRAVAQDRGLPVTFHAAHAARFLKTDAAWREHELALVNPPRTGLSAKLPALLASGAIRRLVYVSCQPATLGRDLARFLEEGFRVEQVDPVDLFPQTAHVECVAVLARD